MRTRAALTFVLLGLATSGLVACGEDSSADNAEELLRYLPTESKTVAAVDVDEARDELGLEADADANDEGLADPNAEAASDEDALQLSIVTGIGAPPLRRFVSTFDADDPLAVAFDGTKISSTASNGVDPSGSVSVIETEQPFSEIADSLTGDGYERDGEVVRGPDSASDAAELADAGDGTIVITGGEIAADEIAKNPPGGPEELDDVINVDGPSTAFAFPAGLRVSGEETGVKDCVRASGGRQSADGSEGVIRLIVDGDAAADSVKVQDLDDAGIDPGSVETSGANVDIPFTVADPDRGASPLSDLVAQYFGLDVFYDCG